MLRSLFLYLGICAVISKVSDTANVWQRSRVLLVADLGSSIIDAEKLQTSFTGTDQTTLPNEFVILQRARDGGFESHGSFKSLTKVQDRKYTSVRKENILPWLLEKKPNFVICVADNAEVPQILTSAQIRGLLPLETRLTIWMVGDNGKAADKMNLISLRTPRLTDLDSVRNDGNRLESREISSSSGRDFGNIILEAFQEEYNRVHNRKRRAARSVPYAIPSSSSSGPLVSAASSSSKSTILPVPSSSSNAVSKVSSSPPVIPALTSSSPEVGASSSSSSHTVVAGSSSPSHTVVAGSSSPSHTVVAGSSSSSHTVVAGSSSPRPTVRVASSSSRSTALPAPSSSSHAFSAATSSFTPVVLPASSSLSRFVTQVTSGSSPENTVVASSTRLTVTTALFNTSPVGSAAFSRTSPFVSEALSSMSPVISAAPSSSRPTVTIELSSTSLVVSAALSSSSAFVSGVPSISASAIPSASFTLSTAVGGNTSSSRVKGTPTSSRSMRTVSPSISAAISATGSVNTVTSSLVGSTISNTMASESIVLSVISPTTTARQPTPSSSHVVTEQPPVYKNETVVIVFDGDCNYLKSNSERENEFRKAVQEKVSSKLSIPRSEIVVGDVVCGSIRVPITFYQSSGLRNVTQVLKKIVDSGNFSLTVRGKTFKASKLEVVRPTSPVTQAPTTEAKTNKIVFYLYVGFGILMAFVFCIGVCVFVVRCRKDRRAGSFFLTNDTNYELRRFHGIPRASSYSRMNYYGEPVEIDATTADPNAEDEFEAGAGAYSYNRSPARGRGKLTGTTNGDAYQGDKFNVGALGMPEWNLPRLSDKEVTVAESEEDIPRSAGSVGSRQLLIDSPKSSLADSAQAYDNPVLTFGDCQPRLGKEENQS